MRTPGDIYWNLNEFCQLQTLGDSDIFYARKILLERQIALRITFFVRQRDKIVKYCIINGLYDFGSSVL